MDLSRYFPTGEATIVAKRLGARGRVILNRPKARNALNIKMIRAIRYALEEFCQDASIGYVTMESAMDGVFCAGGDVRAIREASIDGRHDDNISFFTEEFDLNHLISNYPKPYFALVDGLCMGGGMGLSVHGRRCVISERSTMAMPETSIGYFPDIGASYFLGHLPGAMGIYLGMTGLPLTGADAAQVGLADLVLPDAEMASLIESRDAGETLQRQLEARRSPLEKCSRLDVDKAAIDYCFNARSVSEILSRVASFESNWAANTLQMLERASPTSLEVTLDLFQRTKGLPLKECLNEELRLAAIITRSDDFREGVRAVLVDKDRKPQWASKLHKSAFRISRDTGLLPIG